MVPESCNTVIADKVDSQNTDSPVRGISPSNKEETLLNDESSEEFFTQPRSMVTKRNCVSGGLQLFREKQRAALRSKPFEDNITHTSYQTYSVSPRRISNLQSGGRRETNDDRDKVLNDTETYFVSDLETGSKDNYQTDDENSLRYSSGETVLNSEKFNSTIRNGRVMPAFDDDGTCILVNKNGHLDHTSAICDKTETDLSDTNLSSQEFADLMSKSLKPTNLKFPNTAQNEMAGLSKWEKYNSQHSEEEIDLDMTGFKTKTKDFTVIEKTLEAKQFDRINSSRNDTTQHCHEVSENCSVVSNSTSHCKSVEKVSARADKTHNTSSLKISKLVSPNPSTVPSSFSSVDSFEKMLADENLDFNDPDLDKVLMTQTDIERMIQTDKELTAQSADSKDNKENFGIDTNTLEDSIETKSLCPEISDCNGCSGKADLEIDTDAKAIVADVVGKNMIEQNERDASSVKRISSDDSFSLDDSFLDSHQLHSNSKTTEIKCVPLTTLRVPWKQSVKSINDNKIRDKNDLKTNTNNKPNNELITLNPSNHGNKIRNLEANAETNFMGYDDEEECSYLETENTSEAKGKRIEKFFNKNTSKHLHSLDAFQSERNTTCTDKQKGLQDLSAKLEPSLNITGQSKTALQFQSPTVCSERSQNHNIRSNKRLVGLKFQI